MEKLLHLLAHEKIRAHLFRLVHAYVILVRVYL
jgi:hypothetical protein